jgi:hypothetical protein
MQVLIVWTTWFFPTDNRQLILCENADEDDEWSPMKQNKPVDCKPGAK